MRTGGHLFQTNNQRTLCSGLTLCAIGVFCNAGSASAQTTANYTFGGTSTISIPNPTTYITPDSNGVSESLNISSTNLVTSFNYITITGLSHSFMGDLTATLTHNGTTVDLFDHIGGTTTDYNSDPGYGFVLSSSSTYSFAYTGSDYSAFGYTPYSGWSTVSTGTYQAQGNATGGADSANAGNTLQLFNGQSLNGNWILNIYDNAPLNSGSFSGFILNITSSSATPELSTLPYVAAGFGIITSGMMLRCPCRFRRWSSTAA